MEKGVTMIKEDDKIICRTPTPGKQTTWIDHWKYDLIREKVLEVIPEKGEGILFKDLPGLVKAKLSDEEQGCLGSVSWYISVVKRIWKCAGK